MSDQNSNASGWPAALVSLSIPQFRWLFAGNIAFFFVVQGQIVTRVFLAWHLTGQETALATISLAVAVPMLLASTISGAVADRVNRRLLVLIGQFILLLNEAVVLSLLMLDALQFWHLIAVSFITGCAFPFIMPARMVIIFDIVGPKYFSNAMALASGVINLSRVAGPAFMGLVLDVFDAKVAYLVAVILHGVALLCLLGIKVTPVKRTEKKALFAETVEGLRYVMGSKPILVCLVFGLLSMVLSQPIQSLFVVFSDEVWHVGERGFGMMIAASGAGGLIGSMWVAWRGERANRVRAMIVSTGIFAVLLCGFSLAPGFLLALVALTLANVCASVSQTLNSTIMLLLADENMRGRVSGLMGMSFGLTPLGVIPIAFAAEIFGVDRAVAGASVVLLILTGFFYLRSQTLRLMDKRAQEILTVNRAQQNAGALRD